jgi:hypothetical protein
VIQDSDALLRFEKSGLEQQIHTLTVAPAIANAATGAAISNPIAQACADLAREAAQNANLEGSPGEQMEAERLLEQLGCVHPQNSN